MPIRIFYSWQSDVRVNRNFIRSALEAAVAALRNDLELEEAERDIVIDQDTQGIPGSPSIADVILSKIRSSDIFLADLTFIDGASAEGRRSPNPNVMLEFGYALHALGDAKLIGVFNEAFGSPQELPFDLAHRRWPIRFNLTDESSDRQEQRDSLALALRNAISAIISQFEDQSAARVATPPFVPTPPADGVGRLRSEDDLLSVRQGGEEIRLSTGPYLFLRLHPTNQMPELGEVEALRIAQQNLQPIQGARGGGWSVGRHRAGAVVYWSAHETPNIALDASELFLTRELWGNDFHLLDPTRDRVGELGFAFVPTGAVEEVLIDALINYVRVANNNLGMVLPVHLMAGLVGVRDFRLAVDPQHFMFDRFAGRILRDNILFETEVTDWTADPFDVLQPLFATIYDAAGVERPSLRTAGRRQR